MIGNIFINMICSVMETEYHICLLTHKAKLGTLFWKQHYCFLNLNCNLKTYYLCLCMRLYCYGCSYHD